MRARRILIGLSVCLLCGLTVAACGSSSSSSSSTSAGVSSSTSAGISSSTGASSKKPVVFAVISFQIPGGSFLASYIEGANAAAKYINADGGIDGRKVEIVGCNGMLAPAADIDCAHETLGDNPVAEFGCDTAWSTSGAPIYAAAHVPTMNCPSSPQDNTNPGQYSVIPGVAVRTSRTPTSSVPRSRMGGP